MKCAGCDTPIEAGWAFCGGCGRAVPEVLSSPPHEETHSVEAADATHADGADEDTPLAGSSREAIAAIRHMSEIAHGFGGEPGSTTLATLEAPPALAAIMPTPPAKQSPRKLMIVAAASSIVLIIAGLSYAWADTAGTLSETRETLEETEGSLASMTAARNSLRTDLRTTETRLERRIADLNASRRRVESQAGKIDVLRTCLDGVSSALSYAAYNDYLSAIAALDAVSVACNKAWKLI